MTNYTDKYASGRDAVRAAAGLPLKAADLAWEGTKKIADPKSRVFNKIHPAIPLALVGAVAVPSLMRGEDSARTGQILNDAQALGETPMSDSFHSYVQKRRRNRTKESNLKAPAAASSALGDVVNKLLMKKTVTPLKDVDNIAQKDIAKLMQKGKVTKGPADTGGAYLEETKIDPYKAIGTVGGLGALGTGYNALTTSADNPLQYKLQKAIYGPESRTQASDEYVKNLAGQGGKETAGLIKELVSGAGQRGAGAVAGIPKGQKQMQRFEQAMQQDPYLTEAMPEEKEMLGRAFQTMQKFAPELATDEFAVQNYLRESLMAANGPDYGTISNLARANRDITERPR